MKEYWYAVIVDEEFHFVNSKYPKKESFEAPIPLVKLSSSSRAKPDRFSSANAFMVCCKLNTILERKRNGKG